MENLHEALATRLRVRTTTDVSEWRGRQQFFEAFKFEYKMVSPDVVEQFKTELENHMNETLKIIKPGQSVVYSFDYWDDYMAKIVRRRLQDKAFKPSTKQGFNVPQKPLLLGANVNLAVVFSKLPPLGKGEEYAFPCETQICFTMPKKREASAELKTSVSPWIEAALSKLQP